MDGEVDLDPELPPINSAPAAPAKKPVFNRKRTWGCDAAINNSSDPAVFSSDDHVGSVDEYASKRRKHQWKGTWWGDRVKHLNGSHRVKREFQRNYDSGIFMGSEGTESSFDDEFLDDARKKQNDDLLQSLEDENGACAIETERRPVPLPGKLNSLSIGRIRALTLNPVSERVKAVVHQCLEDGNETVDLSSMYIHNETLPNELLLPLRSLTKYTSIHTPPTSQEAYESLEPQLRVFLSSNLLRTVPSEICNLSSLHVLSLRHNQLTEIPPAISKLANLVELNIGGNQLHTLPWEILQMIRSGQLKKFSPFPNPFRRFEQREMLLKPKPSGPKKRNPPPPTPIASTASTYFAVNGTPLTSRHSPHVSSSSRVPSLLELALRTTTRLPYFADLLPSLLPAPHDDEHQALNFPPPPETLTSLLTHATVVHDAGGQTCPTCGSAFVLARAEWIEWWDLSSLSSSSASSSLGVDGPGPRDQDDAGVHGDGDGDEADADGDQEEDGDDLGRAARDANLRRPFVNVVPFRKRVCSWGCI